MKKGFTLIELLAVILILAIIAVIAVPIVIDIIDEAKINSVKSSANMYLKAAELYISNAELNKVKIESGTYGITEDGNVCIGIIEDNKCNGEEIKIEVKGNKPNKGQIIIDENTNIKIDYLEINGYVYYKDDGEYVVDKGIKENIESDNGVITLDSRKVPYLSNYRIYGNSYQKATTGKNLFDVDSYTINNFGHIRISTKNLIIGEKYTISSSTPFYWFKISNAKDGYNSVSTVFGDEYYTYTFTMSRNSNISPADTQYIFMTLDKSSFDFSKDINEFKEAKIQIEKGTEATSYEPYGVMPSTEYLSEIQSVGNYNEETKKYEIPIKVTGKNLYNIEKYTNIADWQKNLNYEFIENGFKYTSQTNSSYESYVMYYLDFKKILGSSITLSSNIKLNDGNEPLMRIGYWKKNMIFKSLSEISISDSGRYSVTTAITDTLEEEYHQGGIFYNVHTKADRMGEIIEVKDIQVEIGTEATKYEPYKEENYKIELEEPLRCVGDVCDYIDYESSKVVRYIEEIYNTGTKTIEDSFVVLSKPIIESIQLPKIYTNEGVSNVFIETNIKPSKFYVEDYK